MKATFDQRRALRDEFESTKATRDASRSRKGWYASRKAELQVQEAFAEIDDEIGQSYRRRPATLERLSHAQR
ncbi:hypothetical protein [Aquabacterium sp.]|uniref:hypothetical protein n=1 Tax=Aquabacterium sp. TaxID=1872578 RepID=UPI003D6CAA9C